MFSQLKWPRLWVQGEAAVHRCLRSDYTPEMAACADMAPVDTHSRTITNPILPKTTEGTHK